MIVVVVKEQLKVDVIGHDLAFKPEEKEEGVYLKFNYFDKENKKQSKTFIFPAHCRFGVQSFHFSPLTKITFQSEYDLNSFLEANEITEVETIY